MKATFSRHVPFKRVTSLPYRCGLFINLSSIDRSRPYYWRATPPRDDGQLAWSHRAPAARHIMRQFREERKREGEK